MKRKDFWLILILGILSYVLYFQCHKQQYKQYGVADETVNKIIEHTITNDMTDYEKVKAIHDYIVLTTEYDKENLEKDTIPDLDFTAKGVLVKHKGVCRGYAEAFKLLLDELDINNEIITGTADKISHAWNVVEIDNEWYHVDCTYDDPIDNSSGYITESNNTNLRYDYFLITDAQILIDHTTSYKKHACTSDKYMYCEKQKGIPFKIVYSTNQIPELLLDYYKNGYSSVTFYFQSNQDLSNAQFSEKLSILIHKNNLSFTQYQYTPITLCGKYYYATITLQ